MAMEGINRNFDKTDSQILIFGPLFLDMKKNRAMTIFHTETTFSDEEFETLYMLAIHGSKAMPFEKLYHGAWDRGDGSDRRDEALKGINNVMEQINAIEPSILWIEYRPERGYAYRTHEAYRQNPHAGKQQPAERNKGSV